MVAFLRGGVAVSCTRDQLAAVGVNLAGFLVQRVAEGSPGWRLGIRPCTLRASIEGNDLLLGGDIILSINGIEVSRR